MNERIKKEQYEKAEQQLIRENHQLVLDHISNHAKGLIIGENVVFDLSLITDEDVCEQENNHIYE